MTGHKGTILVVDDSPANLKLLVHTLAAEGYQVFPADSGELALASVAARQPELILLEIRMPGLDGFEVYRRLQSRAESRDISVIFSSASGESAERVEGLKLGAVDFITKPFQREELLARVQTHLELRRLRVRLEQQADGLRQVNEQLQTELAERKCAEERLRQSEEKFRTVADWTYDMETWRGPDGRYLYISPSAERITGYRAEEFLADPELTLKITHPDDRARVAEHLEEVSQPGNDVCSLDFRILTRRGEERWISHYCQAVYGADGRWLGQRSGNRDITERDRVETALRDSEANYRALFTTSADGILIADLETKVFKQANPALCRMLGYTHEELGTMGVADIHPKEDLPRVIAEFEAQARGEKTLAADLPCLRKDGTILFADINATMVVIDRKTCLVGLFRDTTERKRAQAELEDVHKQLVEASRRDGMAEIATNVLHNVGNVLNSVNISVGLIVESVKKSRASRLAGVVVLLREHTHDLGAFIVHDPRGKHVPAHLAQLSEHLLADQEAVVSELDSLRRNVEHIKEIVAMQQKYATFGGVKELVNVVDLVEDSLRLNEGALSRHRVEVIREFEKVPLLNVEKHKILQILVNLERNAKYACDESERADRRLTVRVANGEGRVKISVMDNGIGIPPENLTRIFNHGFTTRQGGHGFGLHSGALAAKEMGGSLTVHSDGPGQGAVFTLELPLPAAGGLP